MNPIKITLIFCLFAVSGIKVSQAQSDRCDYTQYSESTIANARRNIAQSESKIQQNIRDFPARIQLARSLSTLFTVF